MEESGHTPVADCGCTSVMVTGAGGFIGASLVRDLAERGVSVVGVYRRPPTSPHRLPPSGVRQVVADFSQPLVWAQTVLII